MTKSRSVVLDLDDSRVVIPSDRRLQKVYLELSSRCNLDCPMCFRESWTEPQGDMDWELFLCLVSNLEHFPHLKTVHFLGMGEPFCHPRLVEAVGILKSDGLRVRITTNATLLDPVAARSLVAVGANIIDLSVEATMSLARQAEQPPDPLRSGRSAPASPKRGENQRLRNPGSPGGHPIQPTQDPRPRPILEGQRHHRGLGEQSAAD